MATYHIDFVNGDDANNGNSWATAWATITNGATSARIAAGDVIKIAKTADEVSVGVNATFTNESATLTLASAITKNIQDATVSGEWTASPNITLNVNASRKMGSAAVTITPASGFTTGKMCYAAITGGGVHDFSGYQKISFWFRPLSNLAFSANTFKVCLCSDTVGNTIVNEVFLPENVATTAWQCFSLDAGGALGSSIQSIAIYATVDPGTTGISFNNFFATNTISLTTPIGKSGDVHYSIRNISETSIEIDSNQTGTLSGQGYSGTSETVPLYYIEPYNYGSNTSWQTLQKSGSASAPIMYIGGWNTSTNLRDGYTFFQNIARGIGNAIFSNLNFNEISYIKTSGSSLSLTGLCSSIDNCYIMQSNSFSLSGTSMRLSNSTIMNLSGGITLSGDVRVEGLSYKNCGSGVSGHEGAQFFNCLFTNNRFSDFSSVAGNNIRYTTLRNCILNNSVEYQQTSNGYNTIIASFNHDQIAGNHWVFSYNTTANWQTSVVHSTEPGAWKITINSGRVEGIPFNFNVANVAVNSGSEATVSVWVKKDHATNAQAKLYVEGGYYTLSGVTYDSHTKANDTDWEQLSVSFTPLEKGVIPIYLSCWNTEFTPENIYVGSVSATQI